MLLSFPCLNSQRQYGSQSDTPNKPPDISHLIPGKYSASIGLVLKNSWENTELSDYLDDAFCFEIFSRDNSGKFSRWDPRYNGYVAGPDVAVS